MQIYQAGFIAWKAEQRQKYLALVANNKRFLILRGGRVKKRIVADSKAKYGQSVALLETRVERELFGGSGSIVPPTGTPWE